MSRPPARDGDENPNRESDIRIPVPWSTKSLEASGPNVINILMWLFIIAAWVWHHFETGKEFALSREVNILQASYQAQSLCVNRLNDEQKQEDRKFGTYCPDPTHDIRRYIQYKKEEWR